VWIAEEEEIQKIPKRLYDFSVSFVILVISMEDIDPSFTISGTNPI